MTLVHKNVLVPSQQDTIQLHLAVEQRFLSLTADYERKTGGRLIPPVSLNSAMIRWRELAVRYRRGDYRNSKEEETALKEIAQWTVDQNCILRGQPLKKVDWK